jgi:hypothetical protein
MKRSIYRLTCVRLIGLAIFALALGGGQTAYAVSFAKVVKRAANISDDVPLARIDDVARDAATSRAGRQLVPKSARRAGGAVEQAKWLRKALRETVGPADRALLKQLDELDQPAQEAALVLSRGAKSVRSAIPDIALRSRFIQDAGGETIAALGRFDDLTADAIRFDAAVRAGRIASPSSLEPVAMAEFGNFFLRRGPAGHHFWAKYVRPHWKLWLAGTALTAVLAAPDEYLDATGNLTRDGIKKLAKFGGDLLGKTLEGTIEGAAEAMESGAGRGVASAARVFVSSIWGAISVFVLACILLALLARTWPIRWLWKWLRPRSEPGGGGAMK